jgi:hypothetical protein
MSAIVGGERAASSFGRRIPRERDPGTHWIGGWMGPRTGLDDEEKRKFFTLPGIKLRLLGRPACSQSTLSRLPFSMHRRKDNINCECYEHVKLLWICSEESSCISLSHFGNLGELDKNNNIYITIITNSAFSSVTDAYAGEK